MNIKELSQIANMELRDQIAAKDVQFENLKEILSNTADRLYKIGYLLEYHNFVGIACELKLLSESLFFAIKHPSPADELHKDILRIKEEKLQETLKTKPDVLFRF